ncbi:MAG: peptide MFS transporter [Candidatus Aminicenantes bacterium]|nr:peptide MFS transporter [Candidatus Aminicenantes bacterium]
MFKGHPKGLFVAFFANMGERFGFYTMVAIFVLFMQAKYGVSAATAGFVYSTFMVCVYFFPLLGGLLADKVLGFGKTISLGMIVMFLGYALLAIPTQMNTGLPLIIVAMAVIAIGTGLFKGNLQALVGNLYDDPKYDALRDRAFTIFYMGINIGAMFAPSASEMISNWILKGANLTYDARIPALANSFLKGTITDAGAYLGIAQIQDAGVTLETLKAFSERYINALSKSYHFGFGVACLSLIVSMVIFWAFRKYYKHADITETQKAKSEVLKSQIVELTPAQTKERLVALGLVFFVVIFFWMAFQQSGLTMTFFARDYTQHSVGALSYLWFDMVGLLAVFLSLGGLVLFLKKGSGKSTRLAGGIAFAVFAVLAFLRYGGYSALNEFQPQRFQHFNPFFIVFMTPVVVGFFGWLNKKKKEPSAPRKIGFGMLITAVSFAILVLGSMGLPSPKQLGGLVAPPESQVSVYWLISTYFIITIAELFLSPIGISYVSKVAPPKYKGLAQGAWFAATAAGLYLMGLVGGLWMKVPLWALWLILVIACLVSATFMFSVMKKLERASGQ